MAIGQFTNDEAENSLESLREMFNAIPQTQRKDYLQQFSRIGTFIQAAQRVLNPLCDSTPGEKPNG